MNPIKEIEESQKMQARLSRPALCIIGVVPESASIPPFGTCQAMVEAIRTVISAMGFCQGTMQLGRLGALMDDLENKTLRDIVLSEEDFTKRFKELEEERKNENQD